MHLPLHLSHTVDGTPLAIGRTPQEALTRGRVLCVRDADLSRETTYHQGSPAHLRALIPNLDDQLRELDL